MTNFAPHSQLPLPPIHSHMLPRPTGSYPSPASASDPYPQPAYAFQSNYDTAYPPSLPSNTQWDSNLLSKYAEFQLQQNHQRQQRALLERQRQQLVELGIPVDDKSLLDQLFGGASKREEDSSQPFSAQEQFVWPATATASGRGAGIVAERSFIAGIGTSQAGPSDNHHEFWWPGSGDVDGKKRRDGQREGDIEADSKRARVG